MPITLDRPFGSIYRVVVDRSVVRYPSFVREVLHEGLEECGPACYDLRRDVETWLHSSQRLPGGEHGWVIHQYLESSGELVNCAGLSDLEEIMGVGVEVYRQLFEDRSVFAPRSVVVANELRGHKNCTVWPYLCLYGGAIVLDWERVESCLGLDDIVLRFKE